MVDINLSTQLQSMSKYFEQHTKNGFTLVEMMIVVAIIAILASIAYPSYVGYQEKGIRTEAMAELEQISGRIASNKLIYKRYDHIPLSAIFSTAVRPDGSVTFPNSGTAYYTIAIAPRNDANTHLGGERWTITATPIATARMKDDGALTLNYKGQKCRGSVCGNEAQWK